MLLVVAESSGSSPGRRGFKMIVTKDDLLGSIGGGVMEIRLAEQAREILSSGKTVSPFITHQVHQKNSETPSGMICSGKQSVIFVQLNASHLETVNEIINAVNIFQQKALVISPEEFRVRDALVEELPEGGTQNAGFFYAEKLGYENRLFIIGGGHCALALSELMSRMDFHISLFDDRPNLNTLEKNRFVQEKKIVESYDDIDELIAAGDDSYVVVMTLGYKSDELVIRKLIDKNFRYFGVLGSKAKMAVLLRELEKEGVSQGKLDSLRTPIGLQINSQTPEEIAISIAAEIIAVKNLAKALPD